MENPIRINKFLSKKGIASRRNSEKLILENRVKINGKFAKIGQFVVESDQIEIDGTKIGRKPRIYWYAINKPKNCISSRFDPENRRTIIDFFNKNTYLFPVGRLDYDTTGIILVTNDGEIAHKLLHPSFEIERKYLVETDFSLSENEIDFLNTRKIYLDGVKSVQKIEKVASRKFLVQVWQGSNHHIKKIFAVIKKKVINLERVNFAGISVGKLKYGEFRKLTNAEIKSLMFQVQDKKNYDFAKKSSKKIGFKN
ncbi:pseudouridine synthase [Mycoplasma sp. 'Moose RK']|uniref:pseudouridine synthase n=1 Tax=Mycoplasma sp. 'Moose RK' TaxID=2780095 RepID=UPI0018C20B85|nr:pseudouridine synthase [Mycoplasma sp. 'Moose RK']MBG0730930.1 rRNA pseudouridine synthase [Mycoplasma sp. 'Moose RK']